MTFAEIFVPEFDAEMESTRKILACVPDEKFAWKPHEKSMALGRLAGHIAETCQWGVEVMTKEALVMTPDFKPWDPANSAEILEKFDAWRVQTRELLANATDEQYSVHWKMEWGGQTIIDNPRSRVIREWLFSHSIHHRGQLGVYLRMLDVAFPGMYGPSATDMEQMKTASA